MALKLSLILGVLLALLDYSVAGTSGYADHGNTKGEFLSYLIYKNL